MSTQSTIPGPPSPTHFIAQNHDGIGPIDEYGDVDGKCCCCGHEGVGKTASDVLNYKYFNDDDLFRQQTGHICASCAYCMKAARSIKIGHWLATPTHYERVSTGDLLETFRHIQAGEYELPIAVYVAKRANISQHSYLWTEISYAKDPLTFTYARRSVTIDLEDLFELIDAVEIQRWHGLRLEDIRVGRPRIRNLESIGRDRYRRSDAVIEPYRGTATLETALTLSRARDDQPDEPTLT